MQRRQTLCQNGSLSASHTVPTYNAYRTSINEKQKTQGRSTKNEAKEAQKQTHKDIRQKPKPGKLNNRTKNTRTFRQTKKTKPRKLNNKKHKDIQQKP